MQRRRAATVGMLVMIAGLLPLAGPSPAATDAASAVTASCTATQKAARTKALKAFKGTMAARRAAHFRAHAQPSARRVFVKRQNAKLKLLQRAARCQVKRANAPAPPPPPPAPPPPALPLGPGAPATYALGPELSDVQRAEVPSGLDMGARYFRTALGRELPAFGVWAHTDTEAMIQTYAATRPTTVADARLLWEGGQVGHAIRRKVWLGPQWFAGSDLGRRQKIAAHEAFHLLQYEVTTDEQWFGGVDDVRAVGPWWLLEGAPEYFAYLAVVEGASLRLPDVQLQWVSAARASATQLASLETFRGQTQTPGAYDIYALAVERLVKDRDPKSVVAYFDLVGSGTPWPAAFAAAFGRSADAFYAEFEAYRAGL